nr:MAG TPA: terminase [Caudoviricetes sp.]
MDTEYKVNEADSLGQLLTQNELDELARVLNDLKVERHKSMTPKRIRNIVPIEKWVMDEYYVGQDGLALYPYWREVLIDIYGKNRDKYNEVIITGGIGCYNIDTTYVSTSLGIMTYSDLLELQKQGKTFTVISEKGESEAEVLVKGEEDTKIVTFSDSTVLEGSLEHRLRVYRNGLISWVKFKDLRVGDTVLKTRKDIILQETENCLSATELIHLMDSRINLSKDISNVLTEGKSYMIAFIKSMFLAHGIQSNNYIRFYRLNYEKRKVLKLLFDNMGISNELSDKTTLDVVDKDSIIYLLKVLGYSLLDSNSYLDDKSVIGTKKSIQRHLKRQNSPMRYKVSDGKPITNTQFKECVKNIKSLPEELKFLSKYNCYEVEVISIKDSIAIVGDVSVKLDPTYISNGFINHNTGKSTAGLYIMVRKLYELSCYINIPRLFQLMSNTLICFIYFTVSKSQAELTGFGQMKNIIDTIPYFREQFPRNDRLNSMLVFPNRMLFLYGSSTEHAIGLNVIGSILDEANFFQQGAQDPTKTQTDYNKISNLYTSIINRGKSRFLTNGKDNSMSVLISSNTTNKSFTDSRIKAAMEDKTGSSKVINVRLWEVKPKGSYSDEMFYVFEGSDLIEPLVIETVQDVYMYTDSIGMDRPKGKTIEEVIEGLPDAIKNAFIKVPIDFLKVFKDNVVQSLQDIAGISVAHSGRLFSARKVYQDCIIPELEHPFTRETFTIATQDKIKVNEFIKPDYKLKDKEIERYFHIDQSLTTDSTGFAHSYIHRYEERDGVQVPIIRVDCMLRINPPKQPRKISIPKVRDFIFWERNNLGLNVGKVTYDSFSSAESLQILEEEGVNSGYLSVDRTDEQYIAFINLMYEGRIEFYRYKPFEEELFELIHFREKRKVDHPRGGSKDVCDAVVGSVWNTLKEGGNGLSRGITPGMYSDDRDEDEIFTLEDLGIDIGEVELGKYRE